VIGETGTEYITYSQGQEHCQTIQRNICCNLGKLVTVLDCLRGRNNSAAHCGMITLEAKSIVMVSTPADSKILLRDSGGYQELAKLTREC
jgi:hypothetical protein